MSITPIHDPLRTENQSREREQRLFAAIELGVIAQAAVDGHLDTDASSEELAVIIAEGQQATVQVWTLFLPMVWSMARPHARGRTSLDDLVGAGCIGLAEAIRRYDPSRGTRFSTLAWTWIRRYVSEESLCDGTSRTMWRRRTEMVVARTAENLSTLRGHAATVAEVAAELGRPKEWVRQRWQIDKDVPLEGIALFADMRMMTHDITDGGLDDVRKLVETLPEPHRSVVRLRHGFEGAPMGLDQVACQLGCSERSVRRIQKQAHSRLRTQLGRGLAEVA